MTKRRTAKAARNPDAHLDALIAQAKQITEAWARRHDLWFDSAHKDPLKHYDDEPGEGGPILLLCSDGPVMSSLNWDDDNAQELSDELDKIGVYITLENMGTACYQLVDENSALQKEFDRYAQWRWMCRLIEADSADVSGDLYRYFADNPEDFHRVPPRDFEKLISSIFSARGWKTELGPRSGDKGVDLRLWQTDPLGDILTLVQIKRYASRRPIHLEAVAALEAHVKRADAKHGLFVTTSRYLPGVKDFAFEARERNLLQLAERSDIQAWCEESAQIARTARNRALAFESFRPLVEQIRLAGTDPRLLAGGRNDTSFCIVLKETKTSALLVQIPSKRISGDEQRGQRMPVLDGTYLEDQYTQTVFRATRSVLDGRVSYWGNRALYQEWDGRPLHYDFWD